MIVAFALVTTNSKLQELRFHKCFHYTLNGTNNTQMLHYQHEDNLSHVLYYILNKLKLDVLCRRLYKSPIIYHQKKKSQYFRYK